MKRTPTMLEKLSVLVLFALALHRQVRAEYEFRQIKIINQSAKPVSVLWIHPDSGAQQFLFSLVNGQETGLDTSVGHEFQLREVPVDSSETCGSGGSDSCLSGYFKVTYDTNQGKLKNADHCSFRKRLHGKLVQRT